MRHRVVADDRFNKGNKVRMVMRRIESYLNRVCEGDKVASGEEYAGVFGQNVQRGKSPQVHTSIPVAPDTFLRYAAFGSNTSQPWGQIARWLGCSIRTLNEVSMLIAQIFATEDREWMPARDALTIVRRWCNENAHGNGYPVGL